jgi:hypothetical protein
MCRFTGATVGFRQIVAEVIVGPAEGELIYNVER